MCLQIFVRCKQYKILACCDRDLIISEIAKHADVTYSHVVKSLKDYKAAGLIISQLRDGRALTIKVTEKGARVLKRLREIDDAIRNY